MTFNQILKKYREAAFSERDKGDRFERLMQGYLLTDPTYAGVLEKVWMWDEFPSREDFGGKDTGIDLVARTTEGAYWAIQCKCYQASASIDKPSVDSFLSTSGRSFKDENGEKVTFQHRLWISTTDKWGANAEEAIRNQTPAVSRSGLYDLQEAAVDWEKLDQGLTGEASRSAKKKPRPHQEKAIEATHEHFKTADRGKLIMACGTGKTYTSLQIAEKETDGNGLVLFLVPSIALLGQTLREWSADAKDPISAICVCSDPKVSKKSSKNEDADLTSVVDLALPASTNPKSILKQFQAIKKANKKGLKVVFSTYQSIDVIAAAQQELLQSDLGIGVFDLIVCDEAHRTTGVTLSGFDESAFVKVHDNKFIQAKKRVYMTATPRLFSDDSKSRAAQADAELCSMDDEALYGQEMYRIGFGEAVEQGLLTDYKVLVLTLSDKDVPPAIQRMIADGDSEINADDASKLIGCINALSKQILGDNGLIKETDPDPMRRAVAFCARITDSIQITNTFNSTSDIYVDALPREQQKVMVSMASKHMDGSMNVPTRDGMLSWLKDDAMPAGECRVLTNVRCLSEGVDVPALDAVMFLSARNSQVDVVQSVGRVMRLSKGKKYGYIIIPVVVPSDIPADQALDDNDRFKVVWTVLNALRAHDDRFNATVNKIELNKKRPDQISVVGVSSNFGDEDGGGTVARDEGTPYNQNNTFKQQLALQFEQLQDVMFARMVLKVGDRRWWEDWAKSVGQIAERQMERINRLINEDGEHKAAFEAFLVGLQRNINPSIQQDDAVEMLSQHIITKPVFEALFEGYSFVKNNPISVSMQTMLDLLEAQALEKDTETLEKFYESVRMRAAGIDNAEGKQRIIIELYDKFFKTAFPKMVEKLGIVYTPVEVVDFIIHSVEDVLKQEFGRSISDENVQVLDPFTGTGTFITRLLQSGLIDKKDLVRKYQNEIHANEIVLLAYYIAAINIENAFHDAMEADDYVPFEGICLTDTFQLGESESSENLFAEMFPQNSARVERQKKAPLRVIMGNPPYSVGQKSANDNAQNQSYEKLDARIAATYAVGSSATSVKALYDSYIKAIRWSTDRLDKEHGGIIAFVSNAAWIDGNGMDGLRKSFEEEFSSIYVFHLRGNQRTSGELSRKEGGKIFGSGSRTPISIALFVKKTGTAQKKAKIFFNDIGDYLSQQEKLATIKKFRSIGNKEMTWKVLSPNEHGDWLNKRNDSFGEYTPLAPEKKYASNSKSIFETYSLGIASARDSWVYNFSKSKLKSNLDRFLSFYRSEALRFQEEIVKFPSTQFDDFCNNDPSQISWNDSLRKKCSQNQSVLINEGAIQNGLYRPFCKSNLCFERDLIQRPYQIPRLFPTNATQSLLICVSGIGASKDFSALMTANIPDLQVQFNGQCFPLYYYEEKETKQTNLFESTKEEKYIRRDGVTDFILKQAHKAYGKNVSKEDIFYYVYGFLYSPDYREAFANDLKKMLPRLPLVDDVRDFWKFSKAGRALADLHINYETVAPYPNLKVIGAELGFFKVEKMRFPKKGEKGSINFNSKIRIEGIPEKAYEYIVNGKSAIEWIMERYRITTHKESGIRNDPNDWAEEVGNPRYILDLVLSIVNVSVQTVDIVNGLPKVEF